MDLNSLTGERIKENLRWLQEKVEVEVVLDPIYWATYVGYDDRIHI